MAAKKKAAKKKVKNHCDLSGPKYCPAMNKVLQGRISQKGIVLLEPRNRSTFKIIQRMVVYQPTTKRGDPPLLLNVCPWCRRKLGQYKVK